MLASARVPASAGSTIAGSRRLSAAAGVRATRANQDALFIDEMLVMRWMQSCRLVSGGMLHVWRTERADQLSSMASSELAARVSAAARRAFAGICSRTDTSGRSAAYIARR